MHHKLFMHSTIKITVNSTIKLRLFVIRKCRFTVKQNLCHVSGQYAGAVQSRLSSSSK